MTVCSRRNFVSAWGSDPYDGNIFTFFCKEDKADKPKRYAMIHDENACIGCTACMDACRDVNQVPKAFLA